mmetsp:Transcript_54988/g.97620  ORF Transcript_54988/g.97620 Transcript_54988/m.97620 type:complete len:86 (-) Transcript_54988:317-574(-)
MASSSSLSFFIRGAGGIRLLNIDPLKDEVQVGENSSVQMPKAKVAAWSKDGISLAIADPDQGVLVLDLADAEGHIVRFGVAKFIV